MHKHGEKCILEQEKNLETVWFKALILQMNEFIIGQLSSRSH